MNTAAKLQFSALETQALSRSVVVSHWANSTMAMTMGSETATNSTPQEQQFADRVRIMSRNELGQGSHK
ncbi:MAG: hypothetical protein MO852_16820, partial [Candidatus Devosia euplotis]|nr:hypothetical protein [Candidatus Devosia euplotis]